ncbi:ABC transporter permease [Nonomuraea sp. NPDC050310]|uniref:ABC transporter permease n=1 Tax=unclassified Nonomuraea TaxID=2593643 RepID=UPI0033FEDE20
MYSLVMAHTRVQILEQLRVPIGLVASAFFPSAAMLAFVVPNVSGQLQATMATGSMLLFTLMSMSLMGLGIGVASDRELPWDPYLRTLPAGPGPRLAARLIANALISLLAMLPVLIIAGALTDASVPPLRLLLGLVAALLATVPFVLMGLTVGYLLPSKAAIGVAQVLFFPIAVLGGLMGDPTHMPAFIAAVSPYVPSRGAVQLIWAATTDFPVDWLPIIMLGVWTVVLGALAAWAYRRDEGRRFS